uniref:Anaphase-promoting complex subunit 4 WD40 domain-containing protein n=1 Tax=Rhizochromulina marina TaxID=1034831 RepID=A0A7S2S063_9STRA|mmetsp:Transcript_23386/g.68281  ORF Transcript_23386/g.68281 Transcript_23386/m.68281 type:complete len:589 (+) Transcript_23386:2-1768(+)
MPSSMALHPKEPRLIYAAGRTVVARSIANAADSFVYRGHNYPVTVAKFSPNGYWVASADESGKVRVWSWDNPEHTLKVEVAVFAGRIIDLDWDADSKRIVAVGDGKTISAKCFMWDTGNSVGEMVGHNKRICTVTYKPSRPFRIMTGGEDFRTCFYTGPPFKLDHSDSAHSKEVWCARFAPDGSKLVTVGADKKIVMYDAREGTVQGEIADAHTSSIVSCAWSPDSAKLATASLDKTVKIWDLAAGAAEATFTFGENPTIADMQCALVWSAEGIMSLNLAGELNVLNPADPSAPPRTLFGHRNQVNSVSALGDSFATAGDDGAILLWSNGESKKILGPDPKTRTTHAGRAIAVAMTEVGIFSVGWDDCLRLSDPSSAVATLEAPLSGQPTTLAATQSGLVVVGTVTGALQVFQACELVFEHALPDTPTAVALLGDTEVAVGVGSTVHILALDASSHAVTGTTATIDGHRGKITALAYAPDGSFLAVGDATREVKTWDRSTWTAKISGKWVFHTTTVTALDVDPTSSFVVSGSLDEALIVWSVAQPMKKRQIKFAHKAGVTSVAFTDENTLVSTGNDGVIATWNLAAAP